MDFLPTLVEIAGAKQPKRTDGLSLVPLFKDAKAKLNRKAIYWHFPRYLQASSKKGTWRTTPAGSIRMGDWKLIEFFEDSKLELYNLTEDIGQKKDLAKANPKMRDELHAMLVQWRREVNAPIPKQKKK